MNRSRSGEKNIQSGSRSDKNLPLPLSLFRNITRFQAMSDHKKWNWKRPYGKQKRVTFIIVKVEAEAAYLKKSEVESGSATCRSRCSNKIHRFHITDCGPALVQCCPVVKFIFHSLVFRSFLFHPTCFVRIINLPFSISVVSRSSFTFCLVSIFAINRQVPPAGAVKSPGGNWATRRGGGPSVVRPFPFMDVTLHNPSTSFHLESVNIVIH